MPRRRRAPGSVSRPRLAELELAFRRETLTSERLRALAVAGFMLALIVVTSVNGRFLMGSWPGTGPVGQFGPAWVEVCLVAYLFMALADVWLISRARRSPEPVVRPVAQYISAFVETLLPTVLMLSQATGMPKPEQAFQNWTGKLYYLFIILSTLKLDFRLSLFTGAASAAQLLVLAAYFLPFSPAMGTDPNMSIKGQILHAALLLLAGILAGGVAFRLRRQLLGSLAAMADRDRVTELFGQHVSAPVAKQLLASPTPDTADVEQACVLFLDVRDFTNWARAHSPDEVMAWLDATFTALVEVVDAHHGFVNKFLGDGFLALFGGPVDDPAAAAHAVSAAREMLEVMERTGRTSGWQARVGIGLHLGPAVAGTVGSPHRKEYTVIGDTVNLASRLEALNKEYGSQLLISQQVLDAAGSAAEGAIPLGPVTLRGYTDAMPIWRLG